MKFDGTISLGNVISVATLLVAIAGAWHALDNRLVIVEVNQSMMKGTLTELALRTDKTEKYVLAHNPDFLNIVGKKVELNPVHTFGAPDFSADFGSMPASAPAVAKPRLSSTPATPEPE